MMLGAAPVWAAPPDDAASEPDAAAHTDAPEPGSDAAAADPGSDADELATAELAQPVPAPTTVEEHAVEEHETVDAGDDPAPEAETRSEKDRSKKAQLPVIVDDKHSITYTSLLAVRVNPLGLEERLWIGYQYRLYDKSKTILNGSNLGIFFRPVVSPAVTLIGLTLQVQPAAVLRLRATYSYVAYFGSFQFFQSFQSPHDDFSDTRLSAMADRGQNYQTTGSQVELEALIQARVKKLVFRSSTNANYNMMNMRGDDKLFYAIRQDVLVANNAWMLYNDTDLLWMQPLNGPRHATILAGARASFIMPFYPDSVYGPGDIQDNPNGPIVRVGPELGYIFYDRPERNPRFNRPTLLLVPQWNVVHPWRTGRDVAAAIPTTVLAFVFTGQLWGKN